MAQIRTVFTLVDNVSSALYRMSNSGDLFNRKLEDMKIKTAQTGSGLKDMDNKISLLHINAGKLVRTLVGVSSTIAIIGNLTSVVSRYIGRINALVKEYEEAVQGETLLTTVMRQRMGANRDMVDSILELSTAMEKNGMYEADMITAGAQELATFVSNTDALKTLIPAMTDLVTQRRGFVAGSQDFVNTATMMGKVIQGQTSALSRYGYVFSDTEEKLLKTGDEMQRAMTLANIITQNIGNPYASLSQTDIGSIMSGTNRINAVKEQMGEVFAETKRQFVLFRAELYESFVDPFVNAVNTMNGNLNGLMKNIVAVGAIATLIGMGIGIVWLGVHWPILLIISAITMLIKIFNELGGSIGNTISSVTGLIGGLVGVVKGIFNSVYNAIATVWNIVSTFVEFIANIPNLLFHPFKTVASLIIGIAQIILNVLSTVIGVIEIFTGSTISDTLNAASARLDEFKNEMWGDDKRVSVRRLELEGIGESNVLTGYNAGRDFGDKVTNAIDDAFAPQNLVDALPTDGNGNIMVTDSSTVQLVDEMRELLARKALEEYIIRVNQVTPQLTIENMNIAETADADAVIEAIGTGMEEYTNAQMRTGVA